MGTTLTPIHGFVKPDANEDATNWPTQNATNMDKVDSLMKVELEPVIVFESTQFAMTPTFVNGSPVCGLTFVAPPSGIIIITSVGRFESGIDGTQYDLQWEIRTGGTIGAGTILEARSNTRAIKTSLSVNTGAPATVGCMYRTLISGLVAGNTHNAYTMHGADAGSGNGTMYHRSLIVEMVHT